MTATGAVLRHERKLSAPVERAVAEEWVRCSAAHCHEIHHGRWINNLYLDDPWLNSYRQHLQGGATVRGKVRIRWYGDLWGRAEEPQLELKMKHAGLVRKKTWPLPAWDLAADLTLEEVRRRIAAAPAVPGWLKTEVQGLELALWNRYWRRYFLSASQRYRVTVDSDLWFACPRPGGGGLLGTCREQETIVEVKYLPADDDGAPLVTRGMPLRVTRRSKYLLGLSRLRAR